MESKTCKDIPSLAASESPSKSQNVSRISQNTDTVLLPDLFVSWAAIPVKVNPNLDLVETEAVRWFNQLCGHDERESSRYAKARFCYLAAAWSADCPAEELRTICDWVHWTFAFDDEIDERPGHIKHKQDLVKLEVEETMSLFTDHPEPYSIIEKPIRYTYDLIWQRIVKKSTKGVQRRYIETSHEYFEAIIDQANPTSIAKNRDIGMFLAHHRGSSGAKILCHMIEYSLDLQLPDYIFEHPDIQRVRDLTAELVVLINDIVSHAKEIKV